MKLTKFQQATVDHVVDRYSNGISRYLVADEVGLGKTVIAGEIIRTLAKESAADKLVVYYICNNERVSYQNKSKLSKQCNSVKTKDLRLSMQWPYIDGYKKSKDKNAIIISLSPATTFTNIGSEKGYEAERGSMIASLEALRGFFNDKAKQLRQIPASYKYLNSFLSTGNPLGKIETKLEKIQRKSDDTDAHEFQEMRRILNDLVIFSLPPDLVVLDEFQNYSSLFRDLKNESDYGYSLRFLIDKPNTKTLLLSATPYRMTTKELDSCRLEAYNKNLEGNPSEDQVYGKPFGEFEDLLEFILSDADQFQEYKSKVKSGKAKEVEDFLFYNAMCRTERVMFYEDWDNEQNIENTPLDAGFDKTIQHLNYARQLKNRYFWYSDSDLTGLLKLAPHFASFGTRYSSIKGGKISDQGFLRKRGKSIKKSMEAAPDQQFALSCLKEQLVTKGIEKLLWIPPLYPRFPKGLAGYNFEAHNPFWKNRDYTKTLIFCSYRMSTASSSGLLSREVSELAQKAIAANPFHKEENLSTGNTNSLESCFALRTNFSGDERKIIEGYSAKSIVDALIPTNNSKIKSALSTLVSKILDDNLPLIKGVTGITDNDQLAIGKYCIMGSLRSVLEEYAYLQEFDLENDADEDLKGLDLMISYLLGHKTKVIFFNGAEEPDKIEAAKDKRNVSSNGYNYLTCNFAERYTDDNTDTGSHNKGHEAAIQYLFNSPFYPFVLSATATAQEGLDFHFYSHLIAHYSVPRTPVEFVQREGRIDRYKSHLMRRRLKLLYKSDKGIDSIQALYEKAQEDMDDKKILFPYWNIDGDDFSRLKRQGGEDHQLPMFKRLTCTLPFSREHFHQKSMEGIMKSYHRVFGPSFQGESDQRINLSPYYKQLNP